MFEKYKCKFCVAYVELLFHFIVAVYGCSVYRADKGV